MLISRDDMFVLIGDHRILVSSSDEHIGSIGTRRILRVYKVSQEKPAVGITQPGKMGEADFKEEIDHLRGQMDVPEEIMCLARGPKYGIASYQGFFINGHQFETHYTDRTRGHIYLKSHEVSDTMAFKWIVMRIKKNISLFNLMDNKYMLRRGDLATLILKERDYDFVDLEGMQANMTIITHFCYESLKKKYWERDDKILEAERNKRNHVEDRATHTLGAKFIARHNHDEENVILTCAKRDVTNSSEPHILSSILDIVYKGHHGGCERGRGLGWSRAVPWSKLEAATSNESVQNLTLELQNAREEIEAMQAREKEMEAREMEQLEAMKARESEMQESNKEMRDSNKEMQARLERMEALLSMHYSDGLVLLEELLELLLGAVVVAPATTSISAHIATITTTLEVTQMGVKFKGMCDVLVNEMCYPTPTPADHNYREANCQVLMSNEVLGAITRAEAKLEYTLANPTREADRQVHLSREVLEAHYEEMNNNNSNTTTTTLPTNYTLSKTRRPTQEIAVTL
ncbi:hypothetical protein Taro_028452 [Colocasia esculenta]|uniref:Uncharacterized protein n=1 Tax=Colocasia esculenta TaxID=4460 RepID=A0A843VB99_COLES|nr:hypothetical protein [Colocasia esculenta]